VNLKRIHVNQHVIRRNRKTGERRPPIGVIQRRQTRYCHVADFGAFRVIYSPDKPLPCGARVWIETRLPLRSRKIQNLSKSEHCPTIFTGNPPCSTANTPPGLVPTTVAKRRLKKSELPTI
jgi:hypothetical protein